MSGSTVLDKQGAAPNGYKVTPAASSTAINFQPTGAGTTADTFTVCRATPSVGSKKRDISIDTTGRAWVTQATTTTCT